LLLQIICKSLCLGVVVEVPACIERVIAAYDATSYVDGDDLYVVLHTEERARTFYKLVAMDYEARLEGRRVVVEMDQPIECEDG
jgi:hypothetical protein